MTDNVYTLAGYNLFGHLVPACHKAALDLYIDNHQGLVDMAEGRICRAGRTVSDTMAEAAADLISGWKELERRCSENWT